MKDTANKVMNLSAADGVALMDALRVSTREYNTFYGDERELLHKALNYSNVPESVQMILADEVYDLFETTDMVQVGRVVDSIMNVIPVVQRGRWSGRRRIR